MSPSPASTSLLIALTSFALVACAGDDSATTQPTEGYGGVTSETATGGTTSATTSTTASSSTTDGTDSSETDTATTGPTTTDPTTTTDATDSDSDSDSDSETGPMPVEPTVLLPKQGLLPEELAVIVNTDDPLSTAIADYYMEARGIPAENRIELSFPTGKTLSPELFAPLKATVDDALGPEIQALALTWTTPYRVGCMSVTSAFALGFDDKYCSTPCNPTAPSGFYNADVTLPYTEAGIRLAMNIAATTEEAAKALIDRGIASDDTFPTGDGYLVRTTDQARSVRWPEFISTVDAWDHEGGLDLSYIDNSEGMGSNVVANTDNILFYFTGLANVGELATNTYIPGAVADHLTSYGGQIPDSGQMSIIKWLEAGATASYGTVVEPCNYPQKFPDTTVLLPSYFRGQTIIEAYWKSVAWPGEGIFVGEPLARPWGASTVEWSADDMSLTITTTLLDPAKTYQLSASDSEDGPWTPVLEGITISEHMQTEIVFGPTESPYYRLDAL